MADIVTASGTKIYVSSAAAASTIDTSAEFAALTWVEVGLVEDVGEFGDESNPVTFAAIGDARVRRSKGARDAGVMSITCGWDAADTGQQKLITAEASDADNYAFKVDFPGTTEIQYFRGLVMSKRLRVGTNDNVIRATFNVG